MIKSLNITPVSMVTRDNKQRINIEFETKYASHLFLSVLSGNNKIVDKIDVAFNNGKGTTFAMLPIQDTDVEADFVFCDKNENILYSVSVLWKKPREWTLFAMISSHTDIGLHNSQYIQRFESCRFTDMAQNLCDETENRDENDRYRYTMEGTWFFNNYMQDRDGEKCKRLIDNYIKTGKIGVCGGVAGNHTQVYGLEEMCRSAYEKKRLLKNWGVKTETLSMIDNNGLSPSLIQAYSEAGYKNLIFAPNHWNPIYSTLWEMNRTNDSCIWDTNTSGGGSRIDVRYDSNLPMVFYWEDDKKNRILVWCSTQYGHGGNEFGFHPQNGFTYNSLKSVEYHMSRQLPKIEEKYPYDTWLFACYSDDQEPNLALCDSIRDWNEKWKFPQIRALGNPDTPFNILREKFDDKIPILKGDITGGWYQHPVSTPELLADKFEVDRILPDAEKWSTIACLLDNNYKYPKEDFRRAWDYLLYNDEHSYGTSGYQGRRVYETWMQHRDWINKARNTATEETKKTLALITSKISAKEESVVVFNSTLQERKELIETDFGYKTVNVPPFGYITVPKKDFLPYDKVKEISSAPPVIENKFYKVTFKESGALYSVFDKLLNKELLDLNSPYGANEIIYTNDNHQTFKTALNADFEIITEPEKTTVIVKNEIEGLGTEIVQKVTLINYEKRIDFDNKLFHVKDMINKNRYLRYLYISFPFLVEKAKRYCHLNGCVCEYAKDVTGHGTDVYMAMRSWCAAENNDFGVACFSPDSTLVEFDHIHPDKTDFANAGDSSKMFMYVANDWLQMHCIGGSHLDLRFRYSITSYLMNYKSAKIDSMAERLETPLYMTEISTQKGTFDKTEQSFIEIDKDLRFLCLKPADDTKGLILRLYGNDCDTEITSSVLGNIDTVKNTVDEQMYSGNDSNFHTFRLLKDSVRIPLTKDTMCSDALSVGAVYTGLISKPMAACGENDGQLYLLWGQNTEEKFSHYKLYRSENENFEANDNTFLCNVYPEEYKVARYEDKNLKTHTAYYYKVCAVDKDGFCGKMSDTFCGITKEI
ncbi:MAG: hypothetical protein J6A69_11665 [Clostridia bacterium]|nr:hypothetical protein [Clostridia bacterium]